MMLGLMSFNTHAGRFSSATIKCNLKSVKQHQTVSDENVTYNLCAEYVWSVITYVWTSALCILSIHFQVHLASHNMIVYHQDNIQKSFIVVVVCVDINTGKPGVIK